MSAPQTCCQPSVHFLNLFSHFALHFVLLISVSSLNHSYLLLKAFSYARVLCTFKGPSDSLSFYLLHNAPFVCCSPLRCRLLLWRKTSPSQFVVFLCQKGVRTSRVASQQQIESRWTVLVLSLPCLTQEEFAFVHFEEQMRAFLLNLSKCDDAFKQSNQAG